MLDDHYARIYYETGVAGHEAELRGHLVSLRQDKAVRAGLEPAFTLLVATPRLHPAPGTLAQCLLSLL